MDAGCRTFGLICVCWSACLLFHRQRNAELTYMIDDLVCAATDQHWHVYLSCVDNRCGTLCRLFWLTWMSVLFCDCDLCMYGDAFTCQWFAKWYAVLVFLAVVRELRRPACESSFFRGHYDDDWGFSLNAVLWRAMKRWTWAVAKTVDSFAKKQSDSWWMCLTSESHSPSLSDSRDSRRAVKDSTPDRLDLFALLFYLKINLLDLLTWSGCNCHWGSKNLLKKL